MNTNEYRFWQDLDRRVKELSESLGGITEHRFVSKIDGLDERIAALEAVRDCPCITAPAPAPPAEERCVCGALKQIHTRTWDHDYTPAPASVPAGADDSPNVVLPEAKEFEARGFERINRHASVPAGEKRNDGRSGPSALGEAIATDAKAVPGESRLHRPVNNPASSLTPPASSPPLEHLVPAFPLARRWTLESSADGIEVKGPMLWYARIGAGPHEESEKVTVIELTPAVEAALDGYAQWNAFANAVECPQHGKWCAKTHAKCGDCYNDLEAQARKDREAVERIDRWITAYISSDVPTISLIARDLRERLRGPGGTTPAGEEKK